MKLLYPDLSFDPAQFTPISLLVRVPNALVVRKGFPAANVKDLIAYGRSGREIKLAGDNI
jgi:tripartite-type tricarboxylate transporter receptor subunit TctC